MSGAAGHDAALERDGLRPPRAGVAGRSMSASNAAGVGRASPFMASGPLGSFASDMHTMGPPLRAANIRADSGGSLMANIKETDELSTAEHRLAELTDRLNKELKIKEGSENLLEALNQKKAKQAKDQIHKVEEALSTSNRLIDQLKAQIHEIQQARGLETSTRKRISNLFNGSLFRSNLDHAVEAAGKSSGDTVEESPTFALSEILQSLETEGMESDYYVARANQLVDLLKRHPTLKYDLAWSVFGLRVQTLLLSDSREVVAAGYRVTRHAITDRKSLQIIRGLNTDILVILSLVKESKASIEREQALKFVRSFLDVKDGVQELSRAIVRTIVAIAEHGEDRLRNICIETLAEILIRDPPLVVAAGGIGPLMDALADGTYEVPESLVAAFLFLLDTPRGRRYLRPGQGLEVIFAAFTDSIASHPSEKRLKGNARVIASVLRTWPGLMVLSMYQFRALKSLIQSLRYPQTATQNVILELFFDILRIKLPSWSSSFLAGRRLTTYGRVANLRNEDTPQMPLTPEEKSSQHNLVDHFLTLTLAVLFESGLQKVLLGLLNGNIEPSLRRKATLLLGEALKMASRLLPSTYNIQTQLLPELFMWASKFGAEQRCLATNTIYQIDSVNRTLQRSSSTAAKLDHSHEQRDKPRQAEQQKLQISPQIDEAQFRAYVIESQVVNSSNYTKWRWDLLQALVEGPLLNPKRLDEAIKTTKFLKRLLRFYQPLKYRFSDIKNTKPNQRYVRAGCALIKTLLQTQEGGRFLLENKLLKQLADCLYDLASGPTSPSPFFTPSRLSETLSCGYFAFIGTMSKDPRGLAMLERCRIISMCYQIIELRNRNDLVKLLLENVDFALQSHFRIMLSKALTSGTKEIRIFTTNLLRSYAVQWPKSSANSSSFKEECSHSEWAIQLLITQLYDPEVEVCETAVKILEEACNRMECLEYVVKCCPALDHLGEIGAPLLLRFLSTSLGYRYLDDLDYITQEMDDWFLGRNDTYVTLVESSLAQALHEPDKGRASDALPDRRPPGVVPPHFYRELTRTAEGCRLLREKGHFSEFASTIRECGLERDDAEVIVKVKGCLWAVGHVGAMELGAPFIEESNVVDAIIRIAQASEILSLRGTAFFVLGLISRSLHGAEMLDEAGWDGAATTMGESLGLYIPLDLQRFFSLRPWSYDPAESTRRYGDLHLKELTAGEDATNARILELVVDLGNTVLTKKAVTDLMHIKAKKPPGFGDARLFRKVMAVLEAHHYRLPVRRYVIDLFEKRVKRLVVLDEGDDDDDEEDENGKESGGEGENGDGEAGHQRQHHHSSSAAAAAT